MAGGETLSDELVTEIVERADGVPLFVEELTKTILEAGEGDRIRAIRPTEPAGMEVPATLHASLLARLDRLGPAARKVAQIGATIGREFPHELLAAVAASEGIELAALGPLAEMGLVLCRGTPPEATYAFKHALVQDAAYSTLLRSRRRQLHATIVHVLQDRFPGKVTAEPGLLAHHCTEAGLVAAAIEYWVKAARLALARSSTAEAIASLNKGLTLLSDLKGAPDRQRLELDLQATLGGALIAAKGFAAPETSRAWRRAGELCREMPDSPQLVKVLYGQYVFHVVSAEAGRLAQDREGAASTCRTPAGSVAAPHGPSVHRQCLGQPGRTNRRAQPLGASTRPL
jgi:predicted ATPase